MKVLFVCTGNTCRSPMAEGLCRAIAREQGQDIISLSVGLFADEGAPVSEKAVLAIKDKEDISEHKARSINEHFINAADMVITMTDAHKALFVVQYPEYTSNILTIGEFAGEMVNIPDPYGQEQEAYNACAKELERLLRKGWHHLEEK